MNLRPCPFCGGDARPRLELSSISSDSCSGFYAEINCVDCGASIDRGRALVAEKIKESQTENHERITKMMNDALKEAEVIWNKRETERHENN